MIYYSYLLDDNNILYFLLPKEYCVYALTLLGHYYGPEGSESIIDMKVIQYVILHDCRFLRPQKHKKESTKNQNQCHPK